MATLAPPPSDLGAVVIEHQAGEGRAVTYGGAYRLGGLDFTRAASGRGVILLQAGAGRLQLAGGDADARAPGRWRLHIDRMALLTPWPARGECEMVTRPAPATYVSLSCRVRIGGDPRPMTVEWHGDGSPAARVR